MSLSFGDQVIELFVTVGVVDYTLLGEDLSPNIAVVLITRKEVLSLIRDKEYLIKGEMVRACYTKIS